MWPLKSFIGQINGNKMNVSCFRLEEEEVTNEFQGNGDIFLPAITVHHHDSDDATQTARHQGDGAPNNGLTARRSDSNENFVDGASVNSKSTPL